MASKRSVAEDAERARVALEALKSPIKPAQQDQANALLAQALEALTDKK